MGVDKSLVTRSTSMMLLKLLEQEDMYGYKMMEELRRRSEDTFELKAGTLYPLLHELTGQGLVESYEKAAASGRMRKYYTLTSKGKEALAARTMEWRAFASAVDKVLGYAGGVSVEAF